MPREQIRKRGKRHKKQSEVEQNLLSAPEDEVQDAPTQPDWIVQAAEPAESETVNPDLPFGEVDNDRKAYFRTVDLQIRDWQSDASVDKDEKHAFFVSALQEMHGIEKKLATEPECSVVLERMAHSMDDFVIRVFMDSLCGSFETLVKNRFASHVVQTLFTLAKGTVSRETNGDDTLQSSSNEGELRTMTQLVLDISEELLPVSPELLNHQYASHVLRALFLLLSNVKVSSPTEPSKKSKAWKEKQGNMASMFNDETKPNELAYVPPDSFKDMARRYLNTITETLSENEIRAMTSDRVACPALQILLHIEQELSPSSSSSLLSILTLALSSTSLPSHGLIHHSTSYLNTLTSSPYSSHLSESVLLFLADKPWQFVWDKCFKGDLWRCVRDPVRHHVLARLIVGRGSKEMVGSLYEETEGSWEGAVLDNGRTDILRALADRAAVLKDAEVTELVVNAFYSTFAVPPNSEADTHLLVPCVLELKSLPEYRNPSRPTDSDEPKNKWTKKAKRKKADRTVETVKAQEDRLGQDPDEKENDGNVNGNAQVHTVKDPNTVVGTLLLQALLRVEGKGCEAVVNSLLNLSPDMLLSLAHSPSASRLFDSIFAASLPPSQSPSTTGKEVKVPFSLKTALLNRLINDVGFERVINDRIGSWVGVRIWEWADVWAKMKLAKSLLVHEASLSGLLYPKFLLRKMNLGLLRVGKSEEWKAGMVRQKAEMASRESGTAVSSVTTGDSKNAPTGKHEHEQEPAEGRRRKKRKRRELDEGGEADEIDMVFDQLDRRPKTKKGKSAVAVDPAPEASSVPEAMESAPAPVSVPVSKKKQKSSGDKDLDMIFSAIKSVPKTNSGSVVGAGGGKANRKGR